MDSEVCGPAEACGREQRAEAAAMAPRGCTKGVDKGVDSLPP